MTTRHTIFVYLAVITPIPAAHALDMMHDERRKLRTHYVAAATVHSSSSSIITLLPACMSIIYIDNKKHQIMIEERIRSKVREKKRRAENESNLELDLIAEAMEKIQKRGGDGHSNIRLTRTTTSTSSPPRHADNRSITVDNTNTYAAGAGAGAGVGTGGRRGTAEGETAAEQQELASAQQLRTNRHQVDVLADLLICSMRQQQQQHQPFSDTTTTGSNRLFPGMLLFPANNVLYNSRGGIQCLPTLAIAPPATGMTYAGSQVTVVADPLDLLLEGLLYRRQSGSR